MHVQYKVYITILSVFILVTHVICIYILKSVSPIAVLPCSPSFPVWKLIGRRRMDWRFVSRVLLEYCTRSSVNQVIATREVIDWFTVYDIASILSG